MGSGSFKQSHFAFCWDLYRILGFSPAQEQGRCTRWWWWGRHFMPDTVLDAEDGKGRTPTHLHLHPALL